MLLNYFPMNTRLLTDYAVPTLNLPGEVSDAAQKRKPEERLQRIAKKRRREDVNDIINSSASTSGCRVTAKREDHNTETTNATKTTNEEIDLPENIKHQLTSALPVIIEQDQDGADQVALRQKEEMLKSENKNHLIESAKTSTAENHNTILARVFTPGKIKKLLDSKVTSVIRWSSEDISSAISLRSLSSKAYTYLKVVMALHEKNLPFETKDIDLNGEQYQSWFLQINPKGEVPVLQDTGKIIPDSARIIDYLEDNFSNGYAPRLMPIDQNPEVRQKVTYFRNLTDKINGNVLTIGSLFHPEFAAGTKKVPFIAPVRNALVKSDANLAENLRKYAEENPAAKEMLLEKAENQEKKREKLLKKEEFSVICNQTEETFNKVEEELAHHTDDKKNWWLCSEQFTVADISLSILMVRINQIGMEPYFWTNGKRPHCEEYFRRVQQRDSYKKTVPTTFSLVKTIFKSQIPLIFGVSIAAAIVIIVGGYFVVKKIANK